MRKANQETKRVTQIPMEKKYLNKKVCLKKAKLMLANNEVLDMKDLDVSKEIFAHAVCFYGVSFIKKNGLNNDTIKDLYNRSKIIDIEDGGDTDKRIKAYNFIWNFIPSQK